MQTRGTKVEETVKYWNVVCKGEDLYIGPYKDSADFIVDTTHIYEPLVYDKFLPKLLKPIQKSFWAYLVEVHHLAKSMCQIVLCFGNF